MPASGPNQLCCWACIRALISKDRCEPLFAHANNGNAMNAVTLENYPEEFEMLKSFSRPQVSNNNPYPE